MQVKSSEVFSIIETIGQHYRANIANRFTRRALTSMVLEPGTWTQIEILTEKSDNYRFQGYHFDELYQQIIAIARFIYQARQEIQPNLRQLLSSTGASAQDRVFRDMAINNFAANLKVLADYVNELYVKTVALDKDANAGKTAYFEKIPELKELGRYLIG